MLPLLALVLAASTIFYVVLAASVIGLLLESIKPWKVAAALAVLMLVGVVA